MLSAIDTFRESCICVFIHKNTEVGVCDILIANGGVCYLFLAMYTS